MSIGEMIQHDVDAAKALFHNVEHNLADAARETFHEAQVLATALEAKIVELGKHTGETLHIDIAVARLRPVLDSVASHIAEVVKPELPQAEAVVQAVVPAPAAPVVDAESIVERIADGQ